MDLISDVHSHSRTPSFPSSYSLLRPAHSLSLSHSPIGLSHSLSAVASLSLPLPYRSLPPSLLSPPSLFRSLAPSLSPVGRSLPVSCWSLPPCLLLFASSLLWSRPHSVFCRETRFRSLLGQMTARAEDGMMSECDNQESPTRRDDASPTPPNSPSFQPFRAALTLPSLSLSQISKDEPSLHAPRACPSLAPQVER